MIETTITKIQYDADGVQRRWSIPFQYADAKHISIYTKVGEEPTVKVVDNYDIDEDDSVVIYPTIASGQEPLATGTKIIIARETPETQLEDASQVHFTSKDVERGLDKLTMITQELSTTAGETMEVAADAFEAAEEAVNSAALANKTAEEAKTIAGQAVGIATDAKSIADGIDAKATQALANSNTAINTANSAKQTAEEIDVKATQALANSTTALETATEAKNTADSYQGQITTIESKIPSAASETNQLADKQFVQDLTSALNFVQWVDALPETGESKYIYAVPREETDTDGKQIAALYLWDGSAWRGAGAFSLNIDPDTLATKTDLAGYLPLSGGTLSGTLKINTQTDTKIALQHNNNSCGFVYSYGTASSPALVLGNNTGQVIGITKGSGIYLKRGHDSSASTILCTLDKAVANGIASLDENAKVPENQLPDVATYQAILREW